MIVHLTNTSLNFGTENKKRIFIPILTFYQYYQV
jgi:hypothetical protein